MPGSFESVFNSSARALNQELVGEGRAGHIAAELLQLIASPRWHSGVGMETVITRRGTARGPRSTDVTHQVGLDEAGTSAGLLGGGSVFSHYWNLVAGIGAGLAARLTK